MAAPTSERSAGAPARPPLAGRAVLVANPAAGGDAGAAEAVAERLKAEVDGVAVCWTTGAGDARRLAATAASDPDVGLVVAVGGDGTVREVAEQELVRRYEQSDTVPVVADHRHAAAA